MDGAEPDYEKMMAEQSKKMAENKGIQKKTTMLKGKEVNKPFF